MSVLSVSYCNATKRHYENKKKIHDPKDARVITDVLLFFLFVCLQEQVCGV